MFRALSRRKPVGGRGSKKSLHWRAVAGKWAPYLGRSMPRDFGPCGTVLDRNTAFLFSHPERDFPYLREVAPLIDEGLFIPFFVNGEAAGTIWAIAHDESRRFDAEDLRVMTDLGIFAAAGYQKLLTLKKSASEAQQFASIVESSDDAIITKTLDGAISSWNKGAERVFGYAAKEVIGKPITILIRPEGRDEEAAILSRIRRGERIASYETVRRRKDGRLIDVSLTVSPLKDANGTIIGASKIARDITERVQAEQTVRASESQLQAAADLVGLGHYAWDPQTNDLEWDDRLRAMWGLPRDAQIDYGVWLAGVHPDDRERVEAAIQRCADSRGDGVYDIEYRVIGKTDGVVRWIATRGQTHFQNGRPVWFYGVALDVTARKRIENRLESLVEARTRELEEANKQLRSQIEQREIAEASVQQLQRLEAIGQTTSGVAHDFNNLLSIVLIHAQLLSGRVLDPEDREGVELICAAAERGAKLTEQLLAFSRQQQLEPQAIDLNSRIDEMRNLLGVTVGDTVRLKMALAPDLWPAWVDPTQIELIVLNLANNARDAMQSGGTLTLETFNAAVKTAALRPEEPLPGNYVGLVVKDTGTGIPYGALARVFEPFFTTKPPGKGSGLGLSQVLGVAKQSGGGVCIDTRAGEGTSVKVFFPRAEVATGDYKRGFIDAGQSPQMKGTANVLVVDDDKSVLKSTLRLLNSLGFSGIAAESAAEALRSIGTKPDVDIVLADVAMPEMNGIELARVIREARPSLPVILVTGYGDLALLKEAGQSQILQKPYTTGDLSAKWLPPSSVVQIAAAGPDKNRGFRASGCFRQHRVIRAVHETKQLRVRFMRRSSALIPLARAGETEKWIIARHSSSSQSPRSAWTR